MPPYRKPDLSKKIAMRSINPKGKVRMMKPDPSKPVTLKAKKNPLKGK